MLLKNWSVTSESCFLAPEVRHYCLMGNVYGHPRFDDGTKVVTSRIVEVKDINGCKEVKTLSGSIYHLYKEHVNEDAEKEYPNYYERFGFTKGE